MEKREDPLLRGHEDEPGSPPAISKDLDADSLWKHVRECPGRGRGTGAEGVEEAIRYVESQLASCGLSASIQECDACGPPSPSHPRGLFRRVQFAVANVVPEGGSPLFVLAGGHGDASLLELARLFHLRRNDLSHGVRFAWWNGGGALGFGPAAWYADHHFDLLRSRCLAYLGVDRLADRSCARYRPFATAELVDWVRDVVKRRSGQDAEPTSPPRDADGSFLGVGLPSFSFLPVSRAQGLEEMDRDRLLEHTRLYADALYELCARPRAPFDLMAVADVLWGELEALSAEVGGAFDLGQAREAVKELVVVLEDHEEEDAAREPRDANRKALDILHLIHPVLYTESGPWGHDLGGNRGVLPGLRRAVDLARLDPGSEERRFLHRALVQERNRVCDLISRAVLVART